MTVIVSFKIATGVRRHGGKFHQWHRPCAAQHKLENARSTHPGVGGGQLRASHGPVNKEGAVPTAPACTSEVRQSSDGPC